MGGNWTGCSVLLNFWSLRCGVAASPPNIWQELSTGLRHRFVPPQPTNTPTLSDLTLQPISKAHHVGYLRDIDHVWCRPLVTDIRTCRRKCHQQLNSRCLHRGAHTTPARRCWLEAHIQEGRIHIEVDSFERLGPYLCCMSPSFFSMTVVKET